MSDKPIAEDYEAAKATHKKEHPDIPWTSLTTRKQNALAKDEMYSRQYQALAKGIMGFRKEKS